MTSLIKQYAQRDSRLENITLTGFIRDNGGNLLQFQNKNQPMLRLT
jgi:hypothetical protein